MKHDMYVCEVSPKRYNSFCQEVLTTLPRLSLHSRDAYLEFSLEHCPVDPSDSSQGELIYHPETFDMRIQWTTPARLELTLPDPTLQTNLPAQTFTLNTTTHALKEFSEVHLQKLFEQGYHISQGRILISRYLPKSLKGAGYDFLPDEDEYEETTLHLKPTDLEVRIAKAMPEDHIEKLKSWFDELTRNYS